MRKAERELFAVLFARLSDKLNVENGRIVSRASDAAIANAVSTAIREASAPLSDIRVQAVKDLLAQMRDNGSYYRTIYEQEGRSGFGDAQQKVVRLLSRRLGIEEGRIKKGGQLDRYFRTRDIRSSIVSTVNSAIAGRRLMSELQRQLEVIIKGTRQQAGVIEAAHTELIRDTYHRTDREASDGFGVALKFKWFSYEGGLIETSRKFCIKRDGQVFNSVEAEGWRADPTLPRTTKERETGVLTDYVPTRDLGRWNCRHRVRWISEQMARRIAPYRFN